MAKSDRSKRRLDDKIKSPKEWVSVGSSPLPFRSVWGLNIDHCDHLCAVDVVLFQSHQARYTYNFTSGNSFWTFCYGLSTPTQISSLIGGPTGPTPQQGQDSETVLLYVISDKYFHRELADGSSSACEVLTAGWKLSWNFFQNERIRNQFIRQQAIKL